MKEGEIRVGKAEDEEEEEDEEWRREVRRNMGKGGVNKRFAVFQVE